MSHTSLIPPILTSMASRRKPASQGPYGFESPAGSAAMTKARARRIAKLKEEVQQAIRNLERTIESGQFFSALPQTVRKRSPKPTSELIVRKIGEVTISVVAPDFPHRYDSFKDKMRAEGMSISGTVTFTYCKAAGDSTSRTVLLSCAYPILEPEYVLGHCMLRNEERTFAIDKIAAPMDVADGTPIRDMREWLRRTK